MRLLVPFGRNRDQLAVAVALGDVGEHDGGQRAGVVQLLAAALDHAVVGELAQHALERGAVGVLQAEGARDLAHADLAGLCVPMKARRSSLEGRARFGEGLFHET